MKQRILYDIDIHRFIDDIKRCYDCNRLIFDMDTPLHLDDEELLEAFLVPFTQSEDSYILGILDDNEKYLYGLVIFDNCRTDGSCTTAQVHIVTDKAVWGKTIASIYREILDNGLIDIMYCEIPQIAVNAIGMCRRLGFKKTGYIPKALPYLNSKGEKKLYDLNIFVYERKF